MPCDGLVEESKRKQLLAELEADLVLGKKRVVRNIKGEVGITNWVGSNCQKSGLCEGCVIRQLQASGSWLVKQKLAAAGVTNKPFVAASHKGHGH